MEEETRTIFGNGFPCPNPNCPSHTKQELINPPYTRQQLETAVKEREVRGRCFCCQHSWQRKLSPEDVAKLNNDLGTKGMIFS
jgi:aspartate carbamoyltransferase regulatory subunit